MKKHLRLFALAAAMILVLCSCGAGGSKMSDTGGINYYEGDTYYDGETNYGGDILALAPSSSGTVSSKYSETKSNSSENSNSALYDSKIIYTASASLQTTEFDETCALIEQMVEHFGGYMESESVYNNSYSNVYFNKRASFTVRVPSESFKEFLSGLNENCTVVSLTQQAEDVGESYFNLEQKLETLNNKHERLEALLKEAKNMSDIITIENALSDTEYEINRYRTNLNRYDNLVGFSTIDISLQEVSRTQSGIDETPGFLERLGDSFRDGFESFVGGLEDLLMFASYHIFTIVIIVVIVVVLIKIRPIRRIRARKGRKSADASAPAESSDRNA